MKRHIQRHSHKPMSAKEVACSRKATAWPSPRRALLGAQFLANRENRPIGVYRCPHCKQWHLTSRPQSLEYMSYPHDPVTRAIFDALHGTRETQARSIYA